MGRRDCPPSPSLLRKQEIFGRSHPQICRERSSLSRTTRFSINITRLKGLHSYNIHSIQCPTRLSMRKHIRKTTLTSLGSSSNIQLGQLEQRQWQELATRALARLMETGAKPILPATCIQCSDKTTPVARTPRSCSHSPRRPQAPRTIMPLRTIRTI